MNKKTSKKPTAKTPNPSKQQKQDATPQDIELPKRRLLISASLAGSSVPALAGWAKPVTQAVLLPAHAQSSPPLDAGDKLPVTTDAPGSTTTTTTATPLVTTTTATPNGGVGNDGPTPIVTTHAPNNDDNSGPGGDDGPLPDRGDDPTPIVTTTPDNSNSPGEGGGTTPIVTTTPDNGNGNPGEGGGTDPIVTTTPDNGNPGEGGGTDPIVTTTPDNGNGNPGEGGDPTPIITTNAPDNGNGNPGEGGDPAPIVTTHAPDNGDSGPDDGGGSAPGDDKDPTPIATTHTPDNGGGDPTVANYTITVRQGNIGERDTSQLKTLRLIADSAAEVPALQVNQGIAHYIEGDGRTRRIGFSGDSGGQLKTVPIPCSREIEVDVRLLTEATVAIAGGETLGKIIPATDTNITLPRSDDCNVGTTIDYVITVDAVSPASYTITVRQGNIDARDAEQLKVVRLIAASADEVPVLDSKTNTSEFIEGDARTRRIGFSGDSGGQLKTVPIPCDQAMQIDVRSLAQATVATEEGETLGKVIPAGDTNITLPRSSDCNVGATIDYVITVDAVSPASYTITVRQGNIDARDAEQLKVVRLLAASAAEVPALDSKTRTSEFVEGDGRTRRIGFSSDSGGQLKTVPIPCEQTIQVDVRALAQATVATEDGETLGKVIPATDTNITLPRSSDCNAGTTINYIVTLDAVGPANYTITVLQGNVGEQDDDELKAVRLLAASADEVPALAVKKSTREFIEGDARTRRIGFSGNSGGQLKTVPIPCDQAMQIDVRSLAQATVAIAGGETLGKVIPAGDTNITLPRSDDCNVGTTIDYVITVDAVGPANYTITVLQGNVGEQDDDELKAVRLLAASAEEVPALESKKSTREFIEGDARTRRIGFSGNSGGQLKTVPIPCDQAIKVDVRSLAEATVAINGGETLGKVIPAGDTNITLPRGSDCSAGATIDYVITVDAVGPANYTITVLQANIGEQDDDGLKVIRLLAASADEVPALEIKKGTREFIEGDARTRRIGFADDSGGKLKTVPIPCDHVTKVDVRSLAQATIKLDGGATLATVQPETSPHFTLPHTNDCSAGGTLNYIITLYTLPSYTITVRQGNIGRRDAEQLKVVRLTADSADEVAALDSNQGTSQYLEGDGRTRRIGFSGDSGGQLKTVPILCDHEIEVDVRSLAHATITIEGGGSVGTVLPDTNTVLPRTDDCGLDIVNYIITLNDVPDYTITVLQGNIGARDADGLKVVRLVADSAGELPALASKTSTREFIEGGSDGRAWRIGFASDSGGQLKTVPISCDHAIEVDVRSLAQATIEIDGGATLATVLPDTSTNFTLPRTNDCRAGETLNYIITLYTLPSYTITVRQGNIGERDDEGLKVVRLTADAADEVAALDSSQGTSQFIEGDGRTRRIGFSGNSGGYLKTVSIPCGHEIAVDVRSKAQATIEIDGGATLGTLLPDTNTVLPRASDCGVAIVHYIITLNAVPNYTITVLQGSIGEQDSEDLKAIRLISSSSSQVPALASKKSTREFIEGDGRSRRIRFVGDSGGQLKTVPIPCSYETYVNVRALAEANVTLEGGGSLGRITPDSTTEFLLPRSGDCGVSGTLINYIVSVEAAPSYTITVQQGNIGERDDSQLKVLRLVADSQNEVAALESEKGIRDGIESDGRTRRIGFTNNSGGQLKTVPIPCRYEIEVDVRSLAQVTIVREDGTTIGTVIPETSTNITLPHSNDCGVGGTVINYLLTVNSFSS